MRPVRARRAVASLLLLCLPLVAACSKNDSNPAAPGNGGTLELNGALAARTGIYQHQFLAAGSYPYHCTIHQGMSGTVTVSSSAPASDSLQSVLVSGSTFTPPSLVVPVGGVVTWVNSDDANHTVTSD